MPARIPIRVLEKIGKEMDLKQVILCAWDGELTHIVTWGATVTECSQAADGGNRVKDALGWPEKLHSQPARVRLLEQENAALKKELADIKSGMVT